MIDHRGHRKPAWHALVEACKPLIVITDPLPPAVHPGDRIALNRACGERPA